MVGMREKLIAHINGKDWWHVPPLGPEAYRKRGKFYSSSFAEAEFWGRPLDQPERVRVFNPLVGDEDTIERTLFGHVVSKDDWPQARAIERRFALDARMRRRASKKGFDAILLMAPESFVALRTAGKLPMRID